MFAVRVAAIPSPSSHRAREGTGTRCRAADSTTIELAYTKPSIVAGSSRAVIPLSLCPDDRVGMPVGDIRRDARHGEHGHRRGQADGAVDAARQGFGRVIIADWVAVGAEPAADCFGKLFLPGGSADRTGIGSGETGAGQGLLLRDRLGGIWEIESGANRPEPVPTEPKQSL